ncbi:MAG: hypothetical protein Kow00117_20860 [Phototrophicales bacterium]
MRTAQASNDVSQIRTAVDKLTQHIQTLGGQMYQQPDSAPAQNGSATGEDEDVIDAEFTDA